ncbi:MAG: class I SAM-dependent methyltransferase [Candidatus Staskawiczbacteria bacterium]
MKQWNEIFKEKGRVFLEPQEDIPKIVKLFKKKGIKKVLDLGCGSGRHTVYLAKNGFDVYGIDISPIGIKLTKDWLKKEKVQATLKLGPIYKKLPYKDNFFDAIVSTSTINHAKIEDIRKLIRDIQRILKTGGLIFMTVMQKTRLRNWHINSIKTEISHDKDGSILKVDYKVIGPRIYVPLQGGEKGLVHYIFNKTIVRKEFKNFKILDIWLSLNKHHDCFLAELKNK